MAHLPPLNESFSFAQWLQQWNNLIKISNSEGKRLFSFGSFICWHIWLAPNNNAHFSRKDWSLMQVIQKASVAFQEFADIHFPPASQLGSALLEKEDDFQIAYSQPGFLSIHTDASLPLDSESRGLGLEKENQSLDWRSSSPEQHK
ncbi:hypothetical protein NE237_026180 [Protea cynaroides]|uniref:Uncharacterized protein n=1 Tax=Protea cynaroides TaxID=273540 RepID=A0A9Q0H4I5_9MAGN|nr:hypothetical protein NE237_026180 [Protea cynaroides]